MKRTTILLLLLVAMCSAAAAQTGTKLFKGRHFSVRYPASFRPGGEKGVGNFATFTSADGAVTFCIYAPPSGSTIPEELFGDNFVEAASQSTDGSVVSYASFYSPKHKRTCSYMARRNPSAGTIHVVGIRYTTNSAFEKYKRQYTAFKKSLRFL